MTDTALSTEDGRPALRIARTLRHPVAKVWRALTEPSELNQWFPFEVETALAVGAEVRFVDKHGGPTGTGTITELDPPRLLGYSWEGDHLRWELSPAAGGSLLVLTHTVADRFGAASFASGWHACLDGLESVLADRPVGPPGDLDAAHEHWLAELGLADAVVTDGPDGWRVRFERQLVRPADLAWRELVATGPTPSEGGPDSGAGGSASAVSGPGSEAGRASPEPAVGGALPEPAVGGALPGPAVGDPVPAGALIGQPGGPRNADLTAGRITELVPAEVLAYSWFAEGASTGQVRWELGQGTGHGARLILTLTGPPEPAAARTAALTGAQQRIATLATALRHTPRP
ncbi:MAG TPA: SRPBCC family protein [Pseudonocardia sp.]|nr:SRPBCC family protein [Pseudonocardia sp.]